MGIAKTLLNMEDPKITVIPDGVSVIVRKKEWPDSRRDFARRESGVF